MNRIRSAFAVIALLATGSACSNEPTGGGSQSGTLSLRLATPHADDGALLFEVSGPPIDSAVAGNASVRVFTRRVDDSTVVGAVVGAVTAGVVVSLRVPDIGAAAAYTARVLEVADRGDALRASLAGYGLTVSP